METIKGVLIGVEKIGREKAIITLLNDEEQTKARYFVKGEAVDFLRRSRGLGFAVTPDENGNFDQFKLGMTCVADGNISVARKRKPTKWDKELENFAKALAEEVAQSSY